MEPRCVASMSGAVQFTAGRGARQAGHEGLEALQADRVQALQFGQRVDVVVDPQVELRRSPRRPGCAAPPTACRACRRRRLRRPASRRSAARPAAGRRWPKGLGGGLQHLRAGQHVAGHAEIVVHLVAAPVDAVRHRCGPRRPAVPSRCSWRWPGRRRRGQAPPPPRSAPQPVGQRSSPAGAVQRVHQRLRRQHAPAPRRAVQAEGTDGEEAAGDGDAEAAVGGRGQEETRSWAS
jgi:hypothetical protein